MGPKKSTAKVATPVSKTSKKSRVTKAPPKKATPKATPKPKSKATAAVVAADVPAEASSSANIVLIDPYDPDNAIATCFPRFQELALQATLFFVLHSLFPKKHFILSALVFDQNLALTCCRETRLAIWGYAAPEPMTVIQRESEKTKGRFTYRRKPPAVLHACRESRLEYLDTDETSDNASIARRRKDHPVYKLWFQEKRLRSVPAYFSVDVDAFYGRQYEGKTAKGSGSSHYSHRIEICWGGIAELEIASFLKLLVIEPPYHGYFTGAYFRVRFPRLEVLTLLYRSTDIRHWRWPIGSVFVEPGQMTDIDGEMDMNVMSPELAAEYKAHKKSYQNKIDLELAAFPNWTPPTLKMRFREKFIENEN